MVYQIGQMAKISPAFLQRLSNTACCIAQMYKVELCTSCLIQRLSLLCKIYGNCLVQPKRVAILVWQCIAPGYRQRGILGLYVGGASCPDAGAIPYRKWIFIA